MIGLVLGCVPAAAQPFTQQNLGAPSSGAKSVQVADLDGDQDQDLVTAEGGALVWFENDGTADPGFTRREILNTSLAGLQTVYVADVDGEDGLDVVFGARNHFGWVENDGAQEPSFTRHDVIDRSGAEFADVHAADVDGDGTVDLMTASKDGVVAWHENDGSATPAFAMRHVLSQSPGCKVDVHPGDLDQDGDTDAVSVTTDRCAEDTDKVVFHENDGTSDPSFTQTTIDRHNSGDIDVAIGDVTGDGRPDVVASYDVYDKILRMTVGSGSPPSVEKEVVVERTRANDSPDGIQDVHLADLDADGDRDVASASPFDDTVAWYQNGEARQYQMRSVLSASGARAVATGDLDGDGDRDLVYSTDQTTGWLENGRIGTTVVYVDRDAAGMDSGASWTDAFPTLQGALQNVPSSPTEIWVAAGTYRPDRGPGQTTDDRSSTFTIPNAVQLYGGFDGTDGSGGGAQETDRSQRDADPATNGTVLTGDVGTQDFPADNVRHVVTLPGGHIAFVDGFTIRDGFADGSSLPDNSGAGIFAGQLSLLELRNARLVNNQATGSGGYGGAYFTIGGTDGTSSSKPGALFVRDALFENNRADRRGGAVMSKGAFINATFRTNTAGGGGAVTYAAPGTARYFRDATFEDNEATSSDLGDSRIGNGGAVQGSGTFVACTFRNNVAANYGGGVSGGGRMRDVTFESNQAYAGGAVNGNGRVVTGTFTSNTGDVSGGALRVPNRITLIDVVVENNTSDRGGGLYAGVDSDADVQLRDVDFVNNQAESSGGAMSVQGTVDGFDLRVLGNETTSSRADGGGGLYKVGGSGTVANAIFVGNRTATDGGAIHNRGGSSLKMVNVTLAHNAAGGSGHGLYTTGSNSYPRFTNSIAWGTLPTTSGGTQMAVGGGTPYVAESIVEGGVPSGATDGGGVLNQSPQFADADGADGTYGTRDDDVRLQGPGSAGGASPAIDDGTNSEIPDDRLDVDADGNTTETLPLDLAGNPRTRAVPGVGEDGSAVVDMGAYESGGEELPVDVAGLTTDVRDDAVRIRWATLSETQNAGFRIQRRTGASGTWTTVGRRDGAGTTSQRTVYQFTDEDLPFAADSLTYRLKQVDVDGEVTYPKTTTVRRGGVQQLQLNETFPNPARQQVTLQYTVPRQAEETDVTLRLYDVLGRRLRAVDGAEKAGRHEQTLSLDGLASGTYFLRLQAGDTIRTRRLTVVQ